MEHNAEKRVLVIEDEANWQKVISELVQDVANLLAYTIQVIIASSFGEAWDHINAAPFDCVTIDNQLQKGTVAKPLLDHLARLVEQVPVIVVSGVVGPDDVRDFFKDYKVEEFFWKDDFKPEKFRQTLTQLLRQERGGDDRMTEWLVILKGAAEIAATTKSLIGFAGDIYRWFENLLSPSVDQRARKVWEDFKRDPATNKDALARVAMDLKPDDDPVLRGYVLGVAKQKLQANRGQIYSLLSGPRYTFAQVQDISARMDPEITGLGRNPSKQELAQWAVNFAVTQDTRWDTLISNMLEINPAVISDVVKLA